MCTIIIQMRLNFVVKINAIGNVSVILIFRSSRNQNAEIEILNQRGCVQSKQQGKNHATWT